MTSFRVPVLLLSLTLNSLLAVILNRSNGRVNVALNTPDLVQEHGYEVEVHNIVTEDGYILEIHRLPYGRYDRERNLANTRRPVLIQHGLVGSSADWILMGPGRSLAYMLADAGYDVWLGNNRGNIYSRKHTSMHPSDKRFWNFSYHELGVYDVPAMIDFILERTNCDKLYYVGHSQGTTQFWVGMSQRPSYNAKIKLMIGLAPVAFTDNIRGPIRKLAKLTYMGVRIGETFGYPEVRSRSAWGKLVANILCQGTSPFFCNNIPFLVTGFTPSNLTTVDLTAIINHIPAGASWKQLVHFGQGYINPIWFRQFDYDNAIRNEQVYGSQEPPEYELNKVTAPVALFSSEEDVLATAENVDRLKNSLSNVVYHEHISNVTFGHYDFTFSWLSVIRIYQPVLDLLLLDDKKSDNHMTL